MSLWVEGLYTYTYQTVGEGTATVEVSNDKTTWITLAEFTNADSAYQHIPGHTNALKPTTLIIYCSEGEMPNINKAAVLQPVP